MAIDPLYLCALMGVTVIAALMAGFPVAFTLAGVALAFAFIGAGFGVFDLGLLAAFPQSLFGLMSNETLVAVPLFVFMGVMMERSGVARDLLNALGTLLRGVPGGLAISVTLVGTALAASTGIVGASVATLGVLALPALVAAGYRPHIASGSIAAAGTLGQIIPPSIVLILLGDQLSAAHQAARFAQGEFAPDTVTVSDLFAGALIPGVALALVYCVYQYVSARMGRPGWGSARGPELADATFREPLSATALVRSLAAPTLLIVAVLGSILGGFATATEAAGVGAVGATVLAGLRLRPGYRATIGIGLGALGALFALSLVADLRPLRAVIAPGEWAAIGLAGILLLVAGRGLAAAFIATARSGDPAPNVLRQVARETMLLSAVIFAIVIGARLFSLVLRGLGGADAIAQFLEVLPGGAAGAVFVVIVTMFVLGFFMEFLEIVYIVVPVAAPVLLMMELGEGSPIDPIWLGVMMAMVLQTSFLTPPFGLSLFYLRSVAPAGVKVLDLYRGIVPYVVIQLGMLVALWWWPWLATGLPRALGGP